MTYKNFFIILFATLFFSFYTFSEIQAVTNSYNVNWGRLNCNGCSTSGIRSTQVTDPWNFQAYAADFGGNYDGHGDFGPAGGKYGVDGCINSNGSMWSGSCWNIVDANGNGNIGSNSGSVPSPYRDIGNTSNNFTYAVGSYYVNDAEIYPSIRVYGRQVSINGFNTTNSTVSVGGQFDITWDTGERTSGSDAELTFSGPVNCGGGSPLYFSGNPGGVTCTGTSAGTATFTLRATGYGAGGTKTVTSQAIDVSIVSPPVSCGNNTVEAGEQCDTGVNNGSCPRSCSNACTVNSCSVNLCGNGVVNAGEQCDSGSNNGAPPRACSNYCTNNVVSGNVNISLTVNGPGTVGTNLIAGRFGPGAYSGTIPTNTFVQFDVIPNPGESNTWTWGGPCSFFNSPLSSVCAGNATVDTANVVTFIPIPVSGTLTPANSSCTIPAGQSGCYSPTLSWSTAGFRNGIVAAVTSSTGVPASVSGNSGSSAFYVPHNPGDPANEFYLSHNGVTLATAVVNTSCAAGTAWSGGVCTVVSSPTVDYVLISSSSVAPDGNTQYTVTIKGTDTGGANKIRNQYALINLGGTNSASRRGWLAWNLTDPWSSHKQPRACGNGYAAILSDNNVNGNWSIYGHQYVDLVGCTSTVSGTERTTVFTVTFPTTFTSPLTLNDIGGAVYNSDGNWNSNADVAIWPWKNFDLDFGLYMPPPTSLTLTCPAPGTSLNATWSSPGAGYNTFYYRASTPSTDWTGNVDQSTVTGTSKSIASVAGQTYNVWVHTRHPSDPSFYSSLISSTVTCNAAPVPAVPTLNLPTATAITTTGATLGATVQTIGVPTPLSARGICYSSSIVNPSLINGATCVAAALSQTAPQPYTVVRSGLTPGTTYNYRGYATNPTGTGYTSGNSTFTTTAAASPTLSASPLTATAGSGNLSATFQNIPTPLSLDWIGLYQVGAVDSSYVDWVWASDCSRTPSTSAPGRANNTSSPCSFPTPAAAGNYEFRMFADNGWTGWPGKLTSQTIVVSGVTPQNTLNVTANPGPGGTITGAGINCGSIVNVDCSENVPAGTVVRLTAVPASSYWKFNGWGGACSGTSTICDVTVSSNPTSVTASFVPRAFIYREF